MSQCRSYRGRVSARRWRLLGCSFCLLASEQRVKYCPPRWRQLSAIAAIIFVPISRSSGWRRAMALVDSLRLAVAVLSAWRCSLFTEMIALTRLPTRTFGGRKLGWLRETRATPFRMIFLWAKTLTGIQNTALCAIIAASPGST